MDRDECLPGLFFGCTALGFAEQFHSGGQGILLVRRVEIKVDAAEGTQFIALAEDDRDLSINREAVPHAGRAVFVGFDGLVKQGDERGLKFVRGFFEADDVFVERLYSGGDFFFETIGSHTASLLQRRVMNREKSRDVAGLRFRSGQRRVSFVLRMVSGIDARRIGFIIQE